MLYDDDGITARYRDGDWSGIVLEWDDQARVLALSLAPGSKLRPAAPRRFAARLVPGRERTPIEFAGSLVAVRL